MARTARHLLSTCLLVAVLVACGGDDGGDDVAVDGENATTTAPAAEGGEEESDDGGEAVDATEVSIVDFRFEPADITVAVGATVTWTNEDEAVHSVADRALDVDSGDMAQGDTFELTYDEAGEFPYVCGIHNYMRGTVTVA